MPDEPAGFDPALARGEGLSAPLPGLVLARSSILVVEDDEAMATLLQAILRMDGHDIWLACTGRTALETLAAQHVDLVLLDVGLPDMDGLDVCRRIKGSALHRLLPIVMLTARARREDRLAGWFAGADDYLVKPVDAEELLARIRALLRTKHAEDSLLRRREHLEAVAALGRAAAASLDPEEVLRRVVAGAQACFEGWDAVVAAGRVGAGGVAMVTSREAAMAVPGGASAYLALATAEPRKSAPYVVRPAGEGNPDSPAAALDTALLVCPLVQAGRAVGVLVVLCPSAATIITPAELALAGDVAQHATLAIENARLFQEERLMVQKLTELDRMKSQFISMASHEFRTPLSVIKGFANLLKRREEFGFDRATEVEYLDVIDTQIQTLTQLIDNMLSVSRIESGQVRVHPQAVDVTATIRRMIALMEVQTAARSIAVTLVGPQKLMVRADPQHVEQVLLNLLSNAIKYSDDGTTVAVHAACLDGMALVAVSDQGVGIDADQMPRLFERFARLDNRRTVEAGGTGLGLYIARNWVEANGGSLWAESTAGQGSTFSFTLPLLDDAGS